MIAERQKNSILAVWPEPSQHCGLPVEETPAMGFLSQQEIGEVSKQYHRRQAEAKICIRELHFGEIPQQPLPSPHICAS